MKKGIYFIRVNSGNNTIDFYRVNGYEVNDSTFIYKDTQSKLWHVSDIASGLRICYGETKEKALMKYQSLIKDGVIQYAKNTITYKKRCEELEEYGNKDNI